MLLEPSALAAHVAERQWPPTGPDERAPSRQSLDLIVRPQRRVQVPALRDDSRSAARTVLTSAGLGACALGLLGADAGLVWLVAGVWTVRSMARAPVGVAWGIACLGVGLRWGTTSLGDIAVATRLTAPTIASGPVAVRIGMVAALVGAALDEAQGRGMRTGAWSERTAAAVALTALVPLFFARGPGDPRTALPLVWGGVASALTIGMLQFGGLARRVPRLAAVVLASAGVIVATIP